DCQWACPAHTPVPEYVRLIAEQRYTEAWAINWESNVFPGILGRTCDRPCEPACRRVRVEAEPVAICRLKRVAADNKGDISPYLPAVPKQENGKRIALVGARAAASSTSPAARKPPPTFILASTGSLPSRSAISTRSAAASSCSAAATRQWIAAAPRAASAARKSRLWFARASRR